MPVNREDLHPGKLVVYAHRGMDGEMLGDPEIGVVKRVAQNVAFCYYHTGDTAAGTPFDMLDLYDGTTQYNFKNAYALDTLVERQKHILLAWERGEEYE